MPDRFEHNRRPDVIFVSAAKWPIDKKCPFDNAWAIVPDLCVEVVSPSDSANELQEKIDKYFDAGVTLVWVVYPDREIVDVYAPGNRISRFRKPDTLTGGTVIPGFELPLAELFLAE
jgi:Uma2 family endonuclease